MALKTVQEITDLKVKEASFVTRGANPGARKMFWKSAEPPKPRLIDRILRRKPQPRTMDQVLKEEGYEPRTTDEVLEDREMWEAWWKLRDAFDTAVSEIMYSDAETKSALLVTSVQQYAARVEEAFASMSKQFPVAGMFGEALDALCADALQKSEFDLEEFITVLDAIEREANAPARSPASGDEGEAMKLIDAIKMFRDATSDERVAFLKEIGAVAKDDADALAKAHADEVLKKTVTCPECSAKFEMSKAVKKAAYLESLPEDVRKSMEERDAKIADLEKRERESVMLQKAKEITPSGMDVALVQADLLRNAGNPEALAAVEKMYSGVKARCEAADKILLQVNGNRGLPKAGSATEEMLAKARSIATAKGISMAKAMDEVQDADPALAERAHEEDRAARMQ